MLLRPYLNDASSCDTRLLEGARRSTLEELTDWTVWADQVVSF